MGVRAFFLPHPHTPKRTYPEALSSGISARLGKIVLVAAFHDFTKKWLVLQKGEVLFLGRFFDVAQNDLLRVSRLQAASRMRLDRPVASHVASVQAGQTRGSTRRSCTHFAEQSQTPSSQLDTGLSAQETVLHGSRLF
jgi:hypothetical protein